MGVYQFDCNVETQLTLHSLLVKAPITSVAQWQSVQAQPGGRGFKPLPKIHTGRRRFDSF